MIKFPLYMNLFIQCLPNATSPSDAMPQPRIVYRTSTFWSAIKRKRTRETFRSKCKGVGVRKEESYQVEMHFQDLVRFSYLKQSQLD